MPRSEYDIHISYSTSLVVSPEEGGVDMTIQTRCLWPNDRRGALTHSVEVDEAGKLVAALCSRVTLASLDDDVAGMEGTENEPPTCPTCYRRDPRFAATRA